MKGGNKTKKTIFRVHRGQGPDNDTHNITSETTGGKEKTSLVY